ncbi:histidine kinase [Pseudoalteromonas aliena]|uniref:Signal transduction histidine kinase internal region domain-containing protein n=1 Tax=Pseudoalteromonas aliena SW19 TaxID=1314866 RepID=A0ABR9DXJ9_9GAMM|nr:histidine kinase [Pseudoalteromonas aliena]MBE0357939.1 hypothetical protein [Pseudoalteromonas aliena SW19]
MLKYQLIFILFFTSFATYAQEPDAIFAEHYYLIDDDDIAYSLPIVNRSVWQKNTFHGIKNSKNIRWVQMDFNFEKKPSSSLGLFISILGSFEAYWDGVLIGKNGLVGDSQHTEVAGLIDKIMLLPNTATDKGTHTLSLRISNQRVSSEVDYISFTSAITEYDYLIQLPYKKASLPLIMTSALLLIALYSLIVFITSYRQPSYLIFSILCLSILVLIFVESWRGLMPYPYDWQIPRLQIVLALSCLISLLFTCFFAWFFKLSKTNRTIWLAFVICLQAVLLIAVGGYDNRSLYVFLVGVFSAVCICIKAIITQQANAKLMVLGLALFIAPIFINSYSYMDQYFFLSFAGLIFLMLYTLAQTMSASTKQLEQSKINASRLELELVKRNLQPHFILNTLTAVEEWIEDSPATAVKFIHALADEFRFMAQLSAKKIINLQDEIDLCRSHLKVMTYRSNINYSLRVDISHPNNCIPPGIILTLIENAISHNHYQQGHITFFFEQKIINNTQYLTFIVPINAITHNSNKNATQERTQTKIGAGIGNKYIAARLNESFSNQWSLLQNIEKQQWVTKISTPLIDYDDHRANNSNLKDPL